LVVCGRATRLRGFGYTDRRVRERGRGEIREWSRKSRERLLETCLKVDWEELGRLVLVTLTYPGDARFVPRDGRMAWSHLEAFIKRWEREFRSCRCLWKKEFQARGALHWMLFVERPQGDIGSIREWVAKAWFEVVGSGETKHLTAGTSVHEWQGDPTGYAVKYLQKWGEKEYQHKVPEGFQNLGRWWGCRNLPFKEERRVVLSEAEGFAIRRAMVAKIRSEGRRFRVRGRWTGLFVGSRTERWGEGLLEYAATLPPLGGGVHKHGES